MKNPPRTTKIRGQKHLLAYITPDEAKLLKAMGGSGEPGPMGIPTFYDEGDDYGGPGGDQTGDDTAQMGGGLDGGAEDRGRDMREQAKIDEARANLERSIAEKGGGTFANPIEDSQMTAQDFAVFDNYIDTYKDVLDRPMAGLTRQQYDAMPGYMRAVYDKTGAYSFDFDDTGRVTGFTGPSVLGFTPGLMGLLTSFAPPPKTEADLRGVYTGFGRMGEGTGPDFGGGRDDTIPAEYNPITGQQNQCPDGYVFDEDLQACRMSADLPSFGTPAPSTGPYEAGDYARMGLLDIAPMGMSLFADRYGVPQMDFDTSNLAFRRGSATRPQYFRQAPELTGYTLLA